MNPELRNPLFTIGVMFCIIGFVMMFSVILDDRIPPVIPIAGIILWIIGMVILTIYYKRKK